MSSAENAANLSRLHVRPRGQTGKAWERTAKDGKGTGKAGCLTVLGISARHVVVGFDEIEGGADHRLKSLESGASVWGHAGADLRAGIGERGERRERVAHHRLDVERAGGLIQGPQGFGTIGIERRQVRERRLREIARGEAPLIERAQEGERVETRAFQPRAQIGRRRRAARAPAASGHAATRTSRS